MAGRAGKKVLLGALLWAGAAGAVVAALARLAPETDARLAHVRHETWQALTQGAPSYVVRFRGGTSIERNNGVFARIDGRLERVGDVTRLRQEGDDAVVTIALDTARGGTALRQGAVAVRRSQGRSFLFALQTLLTEARRAEVARRWQEFRIAHQAAVVAELQPIVSELLQGGARVLQDELPTVLARHAPELDRLAARLGTELGRDRLLPFLAEEVWPVVMRHAAAPAETIGRELWEKIPLFDFAMRAAADKVLEKEPVRVEKRWRDFVRDEAIPTLTAHEGEMTGALQAIANELLGSDRVRQKASALLASLANDPEAKRLAATIARELLLEDARLQAFLTQKLDDPDVRARLQRVADRLQEFLDPVGNLLLLDASGQGINPDLARLIRLLLLRRDAQVLYLDDGTGPPLLDGSEIEGRHDD